LRTCGLAVGRSQPRRKMVVVLTCSRREGCFVLVVLEMVAHHLETLMTHSFRLSCQWLIEYSARLKGLMNRSPVGKNDEKFHVIIMVKVLTKIMAILV